MRNGAKPGIAALLFGISLAHLALALPVSREEGSRQAQVLEQLKLAIGAETTDLAKFAHIAVIMEEEQDVDLRYKVLHIAAQIHGVDLESFLTNLLTGEEDAGLRSLAAKKLGEKGSEKCLSTLAQVASRDRTTSMQIGCVCSKSSTRRSATFAIAELVKRFPKLADDAAEKLCALPVADDVRAVPF